MKKQIIAIGGGGFSCYKEKTRQNLYLEDYFLQQTAKASPSVCFIPTASGDDPRYIVDFYRAFEIFDCTPFHLSLFDPPLGDLETFLLEKDAIYVGGGNTKNMLALWKEWKIDQILRKAYDRGILLGGVSAGANCWFEECVTDSIPGALTPLKCLGFLKGSCCPHYDGEEKRKPAYRSLISEKQITNGIAIDDHVAVHYIDGNISAIKTSKSGKAYQISFAANNFLEKAIEI